MNDEKISLNDLQEKNTNQQQSSNQPKQSLWLNRKFRYVILTLAIVFILVGAGGAFYKVGEEEELKELSKINPTSIQTENSATKTITPTTQTSVATQTTQQPTIKTIDDNVIPTTKISTSNCYAYAPVGWTNIENAAAYAFGYDAYNADQSLGASYLVTAVTVDPYGNYYHNATPDEFIETTMTTLQGWSNFSWISDTMNVGDDYRIRLWQANKPSGENVRAISLYKTWDLNDGTGSYVIVLRQGAARSDFWDQGYSAVVYDAATSVRCTAQVKQNAGASVSTESSVETSGSSDDRLSEARREATMGYENVYDPNTGEHYEAPSNSYNNVGPYGGDPGYYKQVGNDYVKLEKGFGF